MTNVMLDNVSDKAHDDGMTNLPTIVALETEFGDNLKETGWELVEVAWRTGDDRTVSCFHNDNGMSVSRAYAYSRQVKA